MATFHIDEPREIGKKKDRLSSKEKMMVKNDMLEMLAHENTCVNCGNVINEDLKKWFKQKWVNIGKKKRVVDIPLVEQVVRREDTLNVFLNLKPII